MCSGEFRQARAREDTFSTKLFARYQRNEKALVLALMEMYVEGVSTRKVKDMIEELCETLFSKSLVSSLTGRLEAELEAWRSARWRPRLTLTWSWTPATRRPGWGPKNSCPTPRSSSNTAVGLVASSWLRSPGRSSVSTS
jgi:hypothetical protein